MSTVTGMFCQSTRTSIDGACESLKSYGYQVHTHDCPQLSEGDFQNLWGGIMGFARFYWHRNQFRQTPFGMVYCVHKSWDVLTSHNLTDGIPQNNDITYRIVLGCWQEGNTRYYYVAIGVRDVTQLPPPLHLSAPADELSGYFSSGQFEKPADFHKEFYSHITDLVKLFPAFTSPVQRSISDIVVAHINFMDAIAEGKQHHLGFTVNVMNDDPLDIRIRSMLTPFQYDANALTIFVVKCHQDWGFTHYYYEIGDGESTSHQTNRSSFIMEYHKDRARVGKESIQTNR